MTSTTSRANDRREAADQIRVRGARVNNLNSVDLDVPCGKLTVFCGSSGSGKSAMALKVLYAEGRRRYIDCFAPTIRALLEKFDKPEVDMIEGLPPAVGVAARQGKISPRATVGTATEVFSYLRLLFAAVGKQRCLNCGREIRSYSPDTTWEALSRQHDGVGAMICFSPDLHSIEGRSILDIEDELRKQSFNRIIVDDEIFKLDDPEGIPFAKFQTARLLQDSAMHPEDESKTILAAYGLRQEKEFKKRRRQDANEEDDASEEQNDDGKRSARILMLDPDAGHERLKNYLARISDVQKTPAPRFFVVVSRITIGKTSPDRVKEAVATAFKFGDSKCWVLFDSVPDESQCQETIEIDGKTTFPVCFSSARRCCVCGVDYPKLEPNLFSSSTPVGACEMCGGDGVITTFDENLVIPDKSRTLSDGAIAPWRSQASADVEVRKNDEDETDPQPEDDASPQENETGDSERENDGPNRDADDSNRTDVEEKTDDQWASTPYLRSLRKYVPLESELTPGVSGLPLDVPFQELTSNQRRLLFNGSPQSGAPGINGFFSELLGEKYKMHVRVFLAKYQRAIPCLYCHGKRFRKEALGVTFADKTIYDCATSRVSELLATLRAVSLTKEEEDRAGFVFRQILARLEYLERAGLGYLTLDRQIKTLSVGEIRRVDLTKALASDLVDMLYVIDEPSAGLHPTETKRLAQTLLDLRDRGNTVVVVDSSPALLEVADRVVEFGVDAGTAAIRFEGTPQELLADVESPTSEFLTGARVVSPSRRDVKNADLLKLSGASGRNLKDVDLEIPLGRFCLVTGVSGAGKKSLICDTLYPALAQKLGATAAIGGEPLPFKTLRGYERLEEVKFINQDPIGRSPRSNPATYLRIFDEIRTIYASTSDAKTQGFTATKFSFNVKGGRCETCRGEGYVQADMKFLADVYTRCPICDGKRYTPETLNILYETKNIAQALDLTAQEAFVFFRKYPKIARKLQFLKSVGLEQLQLGRPAVTLSGGESQRLKLAAELATRKKGTFFILDEPTAGLHFVDVARLIGVFNSLVDAGASLLVIDHNPLMMKAADYIVDLGPGSGDAGGRIVAAGTPEEVARRSDSPTGRVLASSSYDFE